MATVNSKVLQHQQKDPFLKKILNKRKGLKTIVTKSVNPVRN